MPNRYDEFEWTGLARDADLVVAVSEHAGRGGAGISMRRVRPWNNCVDPQRFDLGRCSRQAVRCELGVDENAPVLVSVAALEERKGIQPWPDAPCRGSYRSSRTSNTGFWAKAPIGAALDAGGRPARSGRYVRFLGSRQDVAAVLAGADVGCLLSRGEAFPLAMLEYLAMGLPAVTSRHAPFDSLVRTEWGVTTSETHSTAWPARHWRPYYATRIGGGRWAGPVVSTSSVTTPGSGRPTNI